MGHSLEWTNHMRNVFVEKWPSLLKCVLVAGAALFIFIHWAFVAQQFQKASS
jgi:hypothetical protein